MVVETPEYIDPIQPSLDTYLELPETAPAQDRENLSRTIYGRIIVQGDTDSEVQQLPESPLTQAETEPRYADYIFNDELTMPYDGTIYPITGREKYALFMVAINMLYANDVDGLSAFLERVLIRNSGTGQMEVSGKELLDTFSDEEDGEVDRLCGFHMEHNPGNLPTWEEEDTPNEELESGTFSTFFTEILRNYHDNDSASLDTLSLENESILITSVAAALDAFASQETAENPYVDATARQAWSGLRVPQGLTGESNDEILTRQTYNGRSLSTHFGLSAEINAAIAAIDTGRTLSQEQMISIFNNFLNSISQNADALSVTGLRLGSSQNLMNISRRLGWADDQARNMHYWFRRINGEDIMIAGSEGQSPIAYRINETSPGQREYIDLGEVTDLHYQSISQGIETAEVEQFVRNYALQNPNEHLNESDYLSTLTQEAFSFESEDENATNHGLIYSPGNTEALRTELTRQAVQRIRDNQGIPESTHLVSGSPTTDEFYNELSRIIANHIILKLETDYPGRTDSLEFEADFQIDENREPQVTITQVEDTPEPVEPEIPLTDDARAFLEEVRNNNAIDAYRDGIRGSFFDMFGNNVGWIGDFVANWDGLAIALAATADDPGHIGLKDLAVALFWAVLGIGGTGWGKDESDIPTDIIERYGTESRELNSSNFRPDTESPTREEIEQYHAENIRFTDTIRMEENTVIRLESGTVIREFANNLRGVELYSDERGQTEIEPEPDENGSVTIDETVYILANPANSRRPTAIRSNVRMENAKIFYYQATPAAIPAEVPTAVTVAPPATTT